MKGLEEVILHNEMQLKIEADEVCFEFDKG